MKKNLDSRNIKPKFHCTHHFLIATGFHYSSLPPKPKYPLTEKKCKICVDLKWVELAAERVQGWNTVITVMTLYIQRR
jgi:hypothetical protein